MKRLLAVKKTVSKFLRKRKGVKTFFILLGLILFGFGLGTNRGWLGDLLRPSADTVSPTTLSRMLAQKTLAPSKAAGFTLVNVHTPYEGEIEKTDAFIAYDQIVAYSASLPKDKNAPIILYCKSGRMSAEATKTVRKLGYTNVRHLSGGMDAWQKSGKALLNLSTLAEVVVPQDGIELPVSWGLIGPQLVRLGVIDLAKFKQAVPLTPEQEKILTVGSDAKIRIDRENGQFVVDLLWALGLAQKSVVYEEGPMGKEYKDDVGNFASTGGWNLARGNATDYLNRFDLIALTPEQQKIVADIAKNVYRPCCGNSTWFPDCNHGMAALAAIELMVSAGTSEDAIYRNILALNSYWFADTYLTVATYFARQGTPWKDVDAKAILGIEYSSAQGASTMAQKVGPLPYQPDREAGSCGA